QAFAPLEMITRPTVTTEEVAFYLNRKPQTHRSCASCEPKGAIKPLRIVGLVCLAVILALLSGDVK
ncbi:MAG TPA: DNA-binding protein, partial [Gallionella sp.]